MRIRDTTIIIRITDKTMKRDLRNMISRNLKIQSKRILLQGVSKWLRLEIRKTSLTQLHSMSRKDRE